jgi:exonuclease SbcC
VSRKGEVKEKITRCAERKEKSIQKKEMLAKELEGLKDTEEKFENIKKRLSEIRADYIEYQKHVHDFERLEERKNAVSVVENAIKETRAIMEKVTNELSDLKKSFSEDKLVNIRKRYEELSNRCASVKTRISELKRVREEVSNRVVELMKIKEEIEAKKEGLEKEKQLMEFIKYLRNIINEASPLITEAYMKRLSYDANKLYRALTGNEACELIWNKDYEITVRERGFVKNFEQLSGGQQMAAALSARLSLLKNISELGIAFFDEPTQNLDRERRENLAEALSKITGFTQLFVISHDDTFDQKVQNLIRLELVDGATKVVK